MAPYKKIDKYEDGDKSGRSSSTTTTTRKKGASNNAHQARRHGATYASIRSRMQHQEHTNLWRRTTSLLRTTTASTAPTAAGPHRLSPSTSSTSLSPLSSCWSSCFGNGIGASYRLG